MALTDGEEQIIIECLCDGLGAEDIAVTYGIPRRATPQFIASLRRSGQLAEIYKSQENMGCK